MLTKMNLDEKEYNTQMMYKIIIVLDVVIYISIRSIRLIKTGKYFMQSFPNIKLKYL